MGRKTKYSKTFPNIVEELASKGYTNKMIAKSIGVSMDSFCEYQNKYPEFADALKRGKEPIDDNVENALLKRALGYDYEEVSSSAKIDKDGHPEPTEIKKTKKHVSPDVTAAIFWLKNRRPEIWRDMKNLHMQGGFNVNHTIIVDNDEQAEKIDDFLNKD